MSERKATELIVAATVQNRIANRSKDVTEQEILSREPNMPPQKGEVLIGTLGAEFVRWFVSAQLEYDRLQSRLYELTEADQEELDKLSIEVAGIFKAQFSFVMAVRGFFSSDFPVDESRPFQLRKGLTVVFFEN